MYNSNISTLQSAQGAKEKRTNIYIQTYTHKHSKQCKKLRNVIKSSSHEIIFGRFLTVLIIDTSPTSRGTVIYFSNTWSRNNERSYVHPTPSPRRRYLIYFLLLSGATKLRDLVGLCVTCKQR